MKLFLAAGAGALLAFALIAAAPSPSGRAALQRGERAYQKCYSCHSLEPGRNDLSGPTLHRILGRRVAREKGFAYSPAMKRFARRHPRWTEPLLDRLIADPEALVPRSEMSFHGIADRRERADLILFLEEQGRRQRRRAPPG